MKKNVLYECPIFFSQKVIAIFFTGPAHQRQFSVCLELGDVEKYVASGPSIKKAYHAAAAIALEKTTLRHPPPKKKPEPGKLRFLVEHMASF